MPKGLTDKSLSFASDVKVIDPSNGTSRTLKANQALELNEAPVLVAGLPTDLRDQARLNAGKRFPWGRSCGCHYGEHPAWNGGCGQGVFLLGEGERRTFDFSDGSSGVEMEGDISHPANFYVHPSFASPQTRDYYIRVAVRRLGSGNVGMNLLYEVADSQGRTPYVNRGNGSAPRRTAAGRHIPGTSAMRPSRRCGATTSASGRNSRSPSSWARSRSAPSHSNSAMAPGAGAGHSLSGIPPGRGAGQSHERVGANSFATRAIGAANR
ncbi:hypothetical protein ACFSHR_05100 [Azotobacter chroococcum]